MRQSRFRIQVAVSWNVWIQLCTNPKRHFNIQSLGTSIYLHMKQTTRLFQTKLWKSAFWCGWQYTFSFDPVGYSGLQGSLVRCKLECAAQLNGFLRYGLASFPYQLRRICACLQGGKPCVCQNMRRYNNTKNTLVRILISKEMYLVILIWMAWWSVHVHKKKICCWICSPVCK